MRTRFLWPVLARLILFLRFDHIAEPVDNTFNFYISAVYIDIQGSGSVVFDQLDLFVDRIQFVVAAEALDAAVGVVDRPDKIAVVAGICIIFHGEGIDHGVHEFRAVFGEGFDLPAADYFVAEGRVFVFFATGRAHYGDTQHQEGKKAAF